MTVHRASGNAGIAHAGFLVVLLLVSAAVGTSCGESEPRPVTPVVPATPPPAPPPPPPEVDTVYVGFSQDRIEITEGRETFADIDYDVYYRDRSGPSRFADSYQFELEMVVEPGSASAGDLLETRAWVNAWVILEPGTTWFPVLALADGLAEETEILTLRMRPVQTEEKDHPPAIEVVNPTMEVVIRDEGMSGACSDVRIAGTRPRNVLPSPGQGSCVGVFETKVTVEADVGDPVYVDQVPPYGRIHGWRVESDGSRIRHEIVLQWSTAYSRMVSMEACPGAGRGPTLVCTVEACETYAAGTLIPAPRIPARCR